MNTIEPLLFKWEGNGISTDDNYERRLPEGAWDETGDFIFHQAATEICDEISPYTLQEKYAEVVESEIEQLKDVLPFPESRIRMGSVSSGRRNRVYYVRGETVILPSRREEGVVRLVSNNKNAARDLRDKLASKLDSIASQFYGAGVDNIDVLTSDKFTTNNISHPNAEVGISLGKPEEFEQQVLDELTPLSEAFVSNVTVDFKNYSPSPEFDILYPQNQHKLVQIEVKDYSGTDNEPGEKEAIQRPLRKASLLDVGQTFTVIRGVEEKTMSELKKHSELRNQIKIIEKHEVTEALQPVLERSLSGGPRILHT